MLTDKQRKLVETNHNLIYSFMNEHNLDHDEYYDLLAIALCKAVKRYDENKGKLSTYIYVCFKNAMKNEYKKMKKDASYSVISDKYDVISTVSAEDKVIDTYFTNDLINNCSLKESQIIQLLISGYKEAEISYQLGVSKQYVNKTLKDIRTKLNCYKEFLKII